MRTLTCAQMADRVGKVIGTSKWFTLDQSRIDAFADITDDHQFIHVDPVAAKSTPIGGTIAHGFLSLSMLSTMSYDAVPHIEGVTFGLNYGFNRLRFLSPVRAGSQVRGVFTLNTFDQTKPGEITVIFDVTIEIENQSKPALVAEWIGRHYLGDPTT